MAAASAAAQEGPSLEEQLTSFWKEKKYAELQALLDARTAATPPDVTALYCSKFFYLFIQPNRPKAMAAATKLKAAADATEDQEFIALAEEELADVQALPEEEFREQAPDVLVLLHAEHAHQYPNLKVASLLKRFRKP